MKLSTAGMAATVLGVIFVLGPIGMVQLNEACDWPRWQSGAGSAIGAGLLLAGIAMAAYCSNLFSRVGEGTPVPTEPPKRLVVSGLYRFSRNPIYVAHLAFLLGLFLHRGELSLLLYAALYAGVLQVWIVGGEEPELRQRFGEEYERYMREVPRWIGIRRGETGG
jgi:protein-S-isoprenylcysteine O-methyltransferase Ste14